MDSQSACLEVSVRSFDTKMYYIWSGGSGTHLKWYGMKCLRLESHKHINNVMSKRSFKPQGIELMNFK